MIGPNHLLLDARRLASNGNFISFLVFFIALYAAPVKAQNSIAFEVPLMINNALSGNINATIIETTRGSETNTTVIVKKQRLRLLLSKFANEVQITSWLGSEGLANVSRKGSRTSLEIAALKTSDDSADETESTINTGEDSASTVSLFELRQKGLDIRFDPSLLSIASTIPILGEQSISLRGRRTPSPESSYASSKFSSGLNLNISNAFNHRAAPGVEQGLGETRVVVDGFTNIGGFGGWSLFYEGDYRECQRRRNSYS